MDVAAFESLPEDLNRAALAAFITFKEKCDADAKTSEQELWDAVERARELRRKHNENRENSRRYEKLIALATTKPDDDDGFTPDEDQTQTSRTRIKYGSVRPKEKLSELMRSAMYFKSDEELLANVRTELGIENIPLKTVQNKMYELASEGAVKRFKSKDLDDFLNGRPEMFDEHGQPKREFFTVTQNVGFAFN